MMTDTSDLARRLLAGDESVLRDILLQLAPAVKSVVLQRYCGVLNESDVEDVLAMGIYRLWNHRDRFDPDRGTVRVWFFRIVDNAARDILKHGWHKSRRLEAPLDPQHLASLADRPTNGAAVPTNGDADRQMILRLREILETLPAAQRQIVLADAQSREGKASSRELSDELGIPASTVRVYRKRALERIRSAFAE
ncbi:MAG: RNA polymerase sigma factor [Planctomycetota bacterium]|nr:RNA polymerase sigma factor [Planctomycetota bacterium]